jgi:hypothetical protein
MGGSNMRGGSGGGLGAGQEGAGVGGAFLTSYNRTNVARGTVMGDAAKGAADAASAFDGSVEAEAIPVGDGNVRQASLDALGKGTDMNPIRQKLQAKGYDVTQNVETAKDIKKKIWGKLATTALLVGVACMAIYFGAKAGGWWGYGAAALATVGALYAIYKNAKEIAELLNQYRNLPYGLDKGAGLMTGISIAAGVLMIAALGLAWYSGAKAKKAAERAAEEAKKTALKKQEADMKGELDKMGKARSDAQLDELAGRPSSSTPTSQTPSVESTPVDFKNAAASVSKATNPTIKAVESSAINSGVSFTEQAGKEAIKGLNDASTTGTGHFDANGNPVAPGKNASLVEWQIYWQNGGTAQP